VSKLDPVRVRFPLSEQLYLKHSAALNRLVDSGTSDGDTPVPADTAKQASPNAAKNQAPTETTAAPRKRLSLQLILADGSTYSETGWLSLIDRAVSINTGSILLEARFPNPKGMLRPGQFGRVRAATDKIDGALAVPQRAVIERQSMREVLVLGAGNKVERRAVITGPQVGRFWIITKGLKAGDKVLTEGVQKVRAGMVVAPHEIPLGTVTQLAQPAASGTAASGEAK
jgi:RND family efflux transporter MFP subunit